MSIGDWLRKLASQGVTVLLCAGFDRTFEPVARDLGIDVVWGLVGPAEHLVDAYYAGRLDRCAITHRRDQEVLS